jgi:hypothetical protein
MRRQ